MTSESLTPADVADIIQDFLEGTAAALDWDQFTLGMSFRDSRLESIRVRCAGLSEEFPPTQPNMYCSEEGLNVLWGYVKELRDIASRDSGL